jgi:hypothetical protein
MASQAWLRAISGSPRPRLEEAGLGRAFSYRAALRYNPGSSLKLSIAAGKEGLGEGAGLSFRTVSTVSIHSGNCAV